jgi:hypothetical protein
MAVKPAHDGAAAAERTAQSLAEQSTEQQGYAKLLEWCTRVGLAVTVLAFSAYAAGVLPAQVPVQRLAQLWTLPSAQYLQATGGAGGWSWLAQVHLADRATLVGIALLAGCSTVPLLALVPVYLRRGDRAFAALCLAEVAVIVLAASGWLSTGH